MRIKRLSALVLAVGMLGALVPATALAAPLDWDVSGNYKVDVVYLGVTYPETLVLTQAGGGTITGTSLGAPCTPSCSDFTITSGSVVGNAVAFATASPFTVAFTGVIAADGSMMGSWADGAGGLARIGTWATTLGHATQEPYDFTGFFAPVDNLPTLNKVKAGSAIPVKFSLNGDQGLDIFSSGYPKSAIIACDASDGVDRIEETVTAGASSLSYDALSDTYTYVWKTKKGWADSCRQLEVKLADGTSHRANFKLK